MERFQNLIREEVSRDYSQGRNESASFLMWFLEKIFGLDKIEAIDCVCDNYNDKGIDGIYLDEQEEEIHIFQSKYKMTNNTIFGDTVLRDFGGVRVWFNNSESIENLLNANINDELRNLINRNKLLEYIETYETHYHFVCNANKDRNAIEYEDNSENLIVWDLEVMFKYYQYISDEPLVQDIIMFNNIDNSEVIEIENISNTAGMLIFPLNANELLRLKGINDYSLFNKNVRYGLGNTRVNKSIRDTLKNNQEKDKFILFHNGISLVCENYIHDKENECIKLINYSVVNGAQSTLAFYKNSRFIDQNTNILLKVMNIGGNPQLMNKITYYNNNQNSINMRDLRSNDNVQKRIEREFKDLRNLYDLKYDYVPKKGKIVATDHIAIESDYAAQLITACYLKNPQNTHLKIAMFTSSYSDIFNRNINAKKILLYFLSHEVLKSNLEQFADEMISSYGLFQYFVLSIVFEIIEDHEASKRIIDNLDHYIRSPETIKKFFNDIYDVLYGIIDHHISEKKVSATFDYKNFFKSKTEVTEMSRSIKTMFNTSLKINRKPFETLCTSLD